MIQHFLEVLERIRPHVPAILEIVGTLALYAFYALFAMAGVVMAVDWFLRLLHRALRGVKDGPK